MTAGFPDPRGGPRSGAPATSARSCSSDFREVTEEVARLASWNFRATSVSGGGALIGRRKTPTRGDWLAENSSIVVGRMRRDSEVGVRESRRATAMKTGRSLSHVV